MMDIKTKIQSLPTSPGIYKFLNNEGVIIYIGKAKNLKKRVAQYFVNSENLSSKTRVLVSKIVDLEHTVVENEQDALLLENNLIKQFQPRYNIMLKDGKSYPWICIKNESFPKIFLTRKFVKDGSLYFGPYSSVTYAKDLLDMISTIYKLRNCKYNLTKEAIAAGKFKPCLNLHIKKCDGPCVGNITEEQYNEQILAIKNILKGNTNELIKDYKQKMKLCADELNFEEAQKYKDRIEALDQHYSKSLIVHPSITNLDVFSIVFEEYNAFGNFFRLNQGAIIQTINLEFKLNIEEEESSVLTRFIVEVYKVLGQQNIKEILVPFLPDDLSFAPNIHVPLRGDKQSLLELSTKNAKAFMFQRVKQEEIKNPDEYAAKSVIALQKELNMSKIPYHIECFDNSNTQGTNPVSACVVFKNGKPSKKDYRHFNIKTVVGANDFASMREVVIRRYSRMIKEELQLPQLIVIDGGKGQLSFAYEALRELNIEGKIEIVGLAKRLEEVFTTYDSTPLYINKNSPALRLLMHMRDEAHRFGITHHRKKRTKGQITHTLREIEGIGETTEQKLLSHFKSVKRIKLASFEEVSSIVGQKLAKKIFAHWGMSIKTNLSTE